MEMNAEFSLTNASPLTTDALDATSQNIIVMTIEIGDGR